MFSVKDIQKVKKEKADIRKETFKVILKKFTNKIKSTFYSGGSNVVLKIPPVIMGYPMYDMHVATVYLQRQLNLLGYKAIVPFDGTIYVTWVFETSKPKTKPTPKLLTYESDPTEDLSSLTKLRETAKKLKNRK